MGCGSLGLSAVTNAKLDAAKQGGASRTVNLKAKDTHGQLREITGGGPLAVVDTVGAKTTSPFRIPRWSRARAMLSSACSTVSFGWHCLRCHCAVSILGSYTGNLSELKELIQLVKDGKVKPIPVTTRPLAQVNQTLNDLRDGKIVGCVVLTN